MRVQNTFRTRLAAAAVVLLAVVLTPAVLFAHAHLIRSTPPANAILTAAPTSLSLWFSERPELKFSKVELLDSTGSAVPLGRLTMAPDDATGITAPITTALPSGRYTIVWRTAAADGHATNGKLTFTLAAAPASTVGPAATPSQSPAQANPIVAPARVIPENTIVNGSARPGMSTAVRWAELVAVLTLVGSVVFRLVVLPGAGLPPAIIADGADRVRRFALGALVLFIVATLTRLSVQSDLALSYGGTRTEAMISVVRGTSWGAGWLIGACGAVLCLVALLAARGGAIGWLVAALGVVAIGTSESLTGHAGASMHYRALGVSVDLAHILGAGAWLGGLTMVLLVGLPALKPLAESERVRAGSRVVRAYHATAVEAVAIVLLTALIAAWLRLGRLDALWTTPYGTMLFRKIFFVAILFVFGWYHRRTAVTPDWDHTTILRFRWSAAAELLIGATVVALTALLVGIGLPTQ
jgi:methionine-rich copper-binding protein CopC/putative copper export protein